MEDHIVTYESEGKRKRCRREVKEGRRKRCGREEEGQGEGRRKRRRSQVERTGLAPSSNLEIQSDSCSGSEYWCQVPYLSSHFLFVFCFSLSRLQFFF